MKKLISIIISAVMVFSSFSPLALADSGKIEISTKEDLLKFSKEATLDSWSVGKKIELLADIELEGEFPSIPSFSGHFDGKGHKITGLEINKDGSILGLFRYNSGKIENLRVEGRITPKGSKKKIGGIVGENSGIVKNCEFNGLVKGSSRVGGISGENQNTGKIMDCKFLGEIEGDSVSGGIVGKNTGLVMDSRNDGKVNTVYEDEKKDVLNFMDSIKNNEEDKNIIDNVDIGGIAGYSSGIVQGCENHGIVGYQHVGYNIGGVIGRQSGYVLGCENYSKIYGRKDVGGIVGQAEPDIFLNASKDLLKEVQDGLDKLNTMVDDLIDDTKDISDDSRKYLDKISDKSKKAKDNTKVIIDEGQDFANKNIDEVNAKTAMISDYIDRIEPITDQLEGEVDLISEALKDIRKALDAIDIGDLDIDSEVDDLTDSIDKIMDNEEEIRSEISNLGDALENLQSSIKIGDEEGIASAIKEISSIIEEFSAMDEKIRTELEKIQKILANPPEGLLDVISNTKEIAQAIQNIKESLDPEILKRVVEAIKSIEFNPEIDLGELDSSLNNLDSNMDSINSAIRKISSALSSSHDKIDDYSDDVRDQLKTAKEDLKNALDKLSNASSDFSDSIGEIGDIVSDLSKEKPLKLVKIGDKFKDASDDLFTNLTDITDDMSSLRTVLKNGRIAISDDIRGINDQFNLVMHLITDEIDELKEKKDEREEDENVVDDHFDDVSEEDIDETRQGKIEKCENFGKIEADRNVGGIVGAMSIEYDKDREDDLKRPKNLNFVYKSRAIVQNCINNEEILGKKDCIGGVVGSGRLGTIIGAQNYAKVESELGSYVGGIAGKSDSSLRKSFSKARIVGESYVGGIAGFAKAVSNCYAISNIEGDEKAGALIGFDDEKSKVSQNYYINTELGGIDGIGYAKRAEPISYEKLAEDPSIPSKFIGFKIRFIIGGKVVATKGVRFGEDTSKITMVKIPERKGYYGRWTKIKEKTVSNDIDVKCIYRKNITTIESKDSLVLAEGSFDDRAKVVVEEENLEPPKHLIGRTKIYKISLLNTDIKEDDLVSLRIRNKDRDKVKIWVREGDKWKEVKNNPRGRYVCFEMKGNKNTFCLEYNKIRLSPVQIVVFIILGLIFIFLGFKLLKKLRFKFVNEKELRKDRMKRIRKKLKKKEKERHEKLKELIEKSKEEE